VNALVVLAHPCPDSFNHAVAAAVERGLVGAGHVVDRIDLYGEGFVAAMSLDERRAYHSDEPIVDEHVRDHVTRLRAADMLVFVYPTWWSGLPAVLHGWLQRVMVPGVGFEFDERGKVAPGLTHVRRIVGVSTYGSPRWYVKGVNDNGRRVLTRALRMSCGWRTRCRWFALYSMDTTTDDDRRRFLRRVEQGLEKV
jgi:NAD(P)H dehydrogenase (quinone)